MTTIYDDALALADDLVALRRRLHAHPEIGLQGWRITVDGR